MTWPLHAVDLSASETLSIEQGYEALSGEVAVQLLQVVPARQRVQLPAEAPADSVIGENVLGGDALDAAAFAAARQAVPVVEGAVGYPLVSRPVWCEVPGAAGSAAGVGRLPLIPSVVDRVRYVDSSGAVRSIEVAAGDWLPEWVQSRPALGLHSFESSLRGPRRVAAVAGRALSPGVDRREQGPAGRLAAGAGVRGSRGDLRGRGPRSFVVAAGAGRTVEGGAVITEGIRPSERRRRERRRVYKSPRWRRLRLAAIARAGRRCERCGGLDPRLHCHHKVPLVRGGAPFDLGNVEVLCPSCHEAERKPKYRSPGEDAWADFLAKQGEGEAGC